MGYGSRQTGTGNISLHSHIQSSAWDLYINLVMVVGWGGGRVSVVSHALSVAMHSIVGPAMIPGSLLVGTLCQRQATSKYCTMSLE